MTSPAQTPFDSVENAHQYINLLVETILEARRDVELDIRGAGDRRLEALRIVQFKLEKLERNLRTSSRLLNDLRTLRRLLLEERAEVAAAVRSGRGKA